MAFLRKETNIMQSEQFVPKAWFPYGRKRVVEIGLQSISTIVTTRVYDTF